MKPNKYRGTYKRLLWMTPNTCLLPHDISDVSWGCRQMSSISAGTGPSGKELGFKISCKPWITGMCQVADQTKRAKQQTLCCVKPGANLFRFCKPCMIGVVGTALSECTTTLKNPAQNLLVAACVNEVLPRNSTTQQMRPTIVSSIPQTSAVGLTQGWLLEVLDGAGVLDISCFPKRCSGS